MENQVYCGYYLHDHKAICNFTVLHEKLILLFTPTLIYNS